MATKHKAGSKKKGQTKRVVTEIAPAVRVMLDSYMEAYNDGPERVSSPLKYTDVINQALDAFLPCKSSEADPDKPEQAAYGDDDAD